MNTLFNPGREGFALGEIDWDTAVIKAALVRGYTFSAAHKFVSDITGAGGTLVATSSALGTKTGTDGVLDAADLTFLSVASGAAITGLLIFQASAVTGGADVAASSQRVIAWIDGTFRFTIAAAASGGATAITVDPLIAAIANGAVANKISGTGPSTITLSASAIVGARSLSVSALGSNVGADAIYEVVASGANMPITPDGNNIIVTWDNSSAKIAKV